MKMVESSSSSSSSSSSTTATTSEAVSRKAYYDEHWDGKEMFDAIFKGKWQDIAPDAMEQIKLVSMMDQAMCVAEIPLAARKKLISDPNIITVEGARTALKSQINLMENKIMTIKVQMNRQLSDTMMAGVKAKPSEEEGSCALF